MEWNIEEDEACCRVCVEKYVVEKRHIDIELCLEIIKKNPVISQRDTKSIRMRIQNIKALLNKWKIEKTDFNFYFAVYLFYIIFLCKWNGFCYWQKEALCKS